MGGPILTSAIDKSDQAQKDFVKEAAATIITYVLELTNPQIPLLDVILDSNLPSKNKIESLGYIYDPSFDDVDDEIDNK